MEEKLAHIGDKSNIQILKPISGGDINQAYYVQTKENNYFVKTNNHVPAHFFQAEADGLERIRATKTIHVPKVFHYDVAKDTEEITLIMEWIDGKSTNKTASMLGEHLAQLHLANNKGLYGLDEATFVGEITQSNDLYENWVDYYRDKRIKPQLDLGIRTGRITNTRRKHLEKLITRLDQFLPQKPRASLLHGDLWGGNWLTGPNGIPYLIDPSIVYGDHLFELAFTEVFGGFPAFFYQRYQEVYSLADYYDDVKPLYQLFYLLIHLNMFGEGYGSSVDRILAHYVK